MKAAIICRVSGETQEREGSSLDSQLAACEKFCSENHIEVGYKLQETFSGLTLDRPKLTELRQMAKNKLIDCIVCYTPDRLSRIGEDILTLAKEFYIEGVKLYFVKDGFENSFEGKLIAFVQGWASELEASKIKERTVRGKLSRAESGKLPSGSGLFGYHYNRETGKREVNERQAEIVRNVFSWYVDDRLSIYAISKRLIDSATLNRAGKVSWTHNAVYSMLKNSAYCGITYVNKYQRSIHVKADKVTTIKPESEWILLPDATPPVISQEMFSKAQEILKSHVNNGTKTGYQYLFKGMLYCGTCGRRFSGTTQRGKPYYVCNSRGRAYMSPCGNKGYAAVKFEADLWEAIKEQLSKPDELLQRIEQANQAGEIRYKLQANIDICNERIKKINQDIRNTIDVYVALKTEDMDIPDCVGKIKDLKTQENALKKEIEGLQERLLRVNEYSRRIKGAKAMLDNIAQRLDNPSWDEKREILITLDVKITTTGTDQHIRILLPDDELFKQPRVPKQFTCTPIEFTFSRL